jgi:predicted NodU family carbamoyl transferase
MNDIVWGISGYSHDASVAVLKNNNLVFASSSERYCTEWIISCPVNFLDKVLKLEVKVFLY